MLPWPWVAEQAMQAPEAAWPHKVVQPSDTNTDSGVWPGSVYLQGLQGLLKSGISCRLWLLWGHRQRHVTRQQPGSETTQDLVARSPTSAHSSSPMLLQNCLLPQFRNHSTPLPLPFLHHILAHHNGTHPDSSQRFWAGLWMLQVDGITRTQASLWWCLLPAWAAWQQDGPVGASGRLDCEPLSLSLLTADNCGKKLLWPDWKQPRSKSKNPNI